MYQLTFPWYLLLMFLSSPDISVACFSFISKFHMSCYYKWICFDNIFSVKSAILYSLQLYESESEVAQSCPTLCDLMDAGSSVRGTFQARVLEWVAVSFSRGSSQTRNRSQVSCTAGRRFTLWATRDTLQLYKDDLNFYN